MTAEPLFQETTVRLANPITLEEALKLGWDFSDEFDVTDRPDNDLRFDAGEEAA